MIRNFCYNCFKNLITIKKDETDNFIRTVSICDHCSRKGKIKYIVEYHAKNEKGLIMDKRWNEKLSDFGKALLRLNEAIDESKNNPVSSTLNIYGKIISIYFEQMNNMYVLLKSKVVC